MASDECKNFEGCAAPLCPMEVDKLRSNPWAIWYPDEEICNLRKFQDLDWIKKQKQIAKKHGSVDHFFNMEMLDAINQVHKGIVGADPDLGERAHKVWLKNRELQKTGRKLAMANEKRCHKS